MAGFPNEFYNSYENQFNSFDFTSSSYGYFNDNYNINDSGYAP